MFIRIAKSDSRYSFIVGDQPGDNPLACFQSDRDAFLVDGLPRDYRSFAEAHGFANRLIQQGSAHIAVRKALWTKAQAEVESTLDPQAAFISHYDQYTLMLKERLSQILADEESQQQRLEAFLQEIDGVKAELKSAEKLVDTEPNQDSFQKILSDLDSLKSQAKDKLPPGAAAEDASNAALGVTPVSTGGPSDAPTALPMSGMTSSLGIEASVDEPQEISGDEILRAIAETATLALQPLHPECFLKVINHHPKQNQSTAVIADPQGDLLVLSFNDKLMLSGIIPSSLLPAYHTLEFLNQYWVPIVDAIGHIKFQDAILVPHHSESNSQQWRGFKENGEHVVGCIEPTMKTWQVKIVTVSERPTVLATSETKLAIAMDHQKMLREANIDPALPMNTAIQDLVTGEIHVGVAGETHRDVVMRLIRQFGRDEAKRRCVTPGGDPLKSHGFVDAAGEFYTLDQISERYLVNDSEELRKHQIVASAVRPLMVRCVDPKLSSLHNRTGVQIASTPKADFNEVLVDFGGVTGNVLLTDRQVKAVDYL